MKRCFKCGEDKPRSGFYAHKAMADGLLGKCKECTKADSAARYAREREKVLAYERERATRPERRAKRIAYKKALRHRHPERARAWSAVGNAIRSGALKRQPCEACGSTTHIQAHHEDYSRPLDVTWLCFSCHREHHGQLVGFPVREVAA